MFINWSSQIAAALLAASVFALPTGAAAKHAKSKGGVVQSDGTIVDGTGFSVSHDATGKYTIDVPAGYFGSTCPVILVTPGGINSELPIVNDWDYITCGGNGEVKMQILIKGRPDGANVDNSFQFLIMEP